jgi:hypothetical protein
MDGAQCFECNSTLAYFDSNSNLCVNCPSPCLECKSSTECLSCADNTTLLDLNVLPGTINCRLCSEYIPHCITCLSRTVCMSCEVTITNGPFFLSNPPSKFRINFQCDAGIVLKLCPTVNNAPYPRVQNQQQFAKNAKMVHICLLANVTHVPWDVLCAQMQQPARAVHPQHLLFTIKCVYFVEKSCQTALNVPATLFALVALKNGYLKMPVIFENI